MSTADALHKDRGPLSMVSSLLFFIMEEFHKLFQSGKRYVTPQVRY